MTLPYTFAALTAPQMSNLDSNFAAFGAITTIPCTVAGTNTLTLTPVANTPTVAVYSQLQAYSGIASATNTTAVTVAVGALPALPVYKDTSGGPVALTGSEIVIKNLFFLIYDAALNSGNGGFHLR